MKKLKVGQKFYSRDGLNWYVEILRIEEDGNYYCLMKSPKNSGLSIKSVKSIVDYEYLNRAYLIK